MCLRVEDMALLAAVVAGNVEGEAAFHRRYAPRFEIVARQAGVPAQDCEDVAQDAMMAAVSQIKRGIFRGDCSLGTWLEVILRGKIADYKRSLRFRMASAEVGADDP